MNRYQSAIPIGFALLCLFWSGCNRPEQPKPYVISFNTELIDSPSKRDLAKWKENISAAIDSVSNYLGFTYSDTLHVIVLKEGHVESRTGRIYMTPYALGWKENIYGLITTAITLPQSSIFITTVSQF
jgi:hypothetical protein